MIHLQFCSFSSTMGYLIEWFTQGTVGHVDAVMPDGMLLGAQHEDGLGGKPSGVQIRPPGYGGMRDPIIIEIEATEAQSDRFYDFVLAQVGKPYDTEAILAFIAGRNWRDDRAWYCSELQAAALEHAGVFAHPIITPSNKITPAALLTLCSAIGEVRKAA